MESWQNGKDHDGVLDGFEREQLAEAEAADVLDLENDQPLTPYEEQREAMIDAERSAYYGDLGVRA
jgi:hypothetical protein